ncbi:RidA family protein [Nocardioides sp. AX2bis]|uniref:RidA family protein n=1 Tax=Nocardioides sp. AX2bis TaxID=2653157 RepID=UPI0012F0DC7E|nr:RidA family protein [Nocardioides sp. AX2bis]VXC56225.1 hypothetical protein NOCARDAX2BIS_90030 [Nocardioides sp. AX2bis]
MDLDRLQTTLRVRPDEASHDCADAIGRGSRPETFPGRATTANLLTIYRRRAAHVVAVGLEHAGFDRTVDDLATCGHPELRLAEVTDHTAGRHYVLFVAPETDDVVACLWVRSERPATGAQDPLVDDPEDPAVRWRFRHVVRSRGLLLCSGVTGVRADGTVDPDPATQFHQAFAHLEAVLATAGATTADLVELTTYHVGLREHFLAFAAVKDEHVPAPYPAWSAIGIAELVVPGTLVEIRAVAEDPFS